LLGDEDGDSRENEEREKSQLIIYRLELTASLKLILITRDLVTVPLVGGTTVMPWALSIR
jgi:hypothetical protein